MQMGTAISCTECSQGTAISCTECSQVAGISCTECSQVAGLIQKLVETPRKHHLADGALDSIILILYTCMPIPY